MNWRLWAHSGNCRGDKRTVNNEGRISRRFDGCRLRPSAANSLSGIRKRTVDEAGEGLKRLLKNI
jgi:hypothetical protein